MRYEFDPTKDDGNLEKHGLSLVDAESFEWETAVVHEDTRKQYAEPRFQAAGYIGNRLHVMVFVFALTLCVLSACARPTQER